MTAQLDSILAMAAELSLAEMRILDEWLHERIEEGEALEQVPVSPSRRVIEERHTPTATYRLELVKCGKARCRSCAAGPAHGPYWYAYWKENGRTRSKYIGKQFHTA